MESHPLIERFFEGECTPAERAELITWLRASQANRDLFARESLMYLGLPDAMHASSLSDEMDDLSLFVDDAEESGGPSFEEQLASLAPGDQPATLVDLTPRVIAEMAQARRAAQVSREKESRRRASLDRKPDTVIFPRWLAYGSAIAACLALSLAVYVQSRPNSATPTPSAQTPADRNGSGPAAADPVVYASVESSVGAARRGGQPLRAGELLTDDEIDLVSGLARVRFEGGAVVTVEAPARLVIVDEGRMRLESGRVFARAEGQAFSITTEAGSLTAVGSADRGAAFGVAVSGGQLTAHAFEGRLALQTTGSQATDTVSLAAGHALRVRGGAVQHDPIDPLAFVMDQEYDIQLRVQAGDTEASWLAYAQELRRRDGLLLYLSPDLAEHLEAEASVNLAEHAPAQSRRQRGAARDSRMLETLDRRASFMFDTDADRLIYDLSESYERLTLAAWVYVPAGSHPDRLLALVMSEADQPGELHWQLACQQNGGWVLRLGILEGIPLSDPHIFRDVDTTLPGAARSGRWVHLVTTLDTRQGVAATYLNGELTDSQPLSRTGLVRLGRIHVGNWKVLPGAGNNARFLSGAISDLTIFDVTLDGESVKELYESTAR